MDGPISIRIWAEQSGCSGLLKKGGQEVGVRLKWIREESGVNVINDLSVSIKFLKN